MATATDPTFLARERLAGYEPEALDAARVVVVGAGALGGKPLHRGLRYPELPLHLTHGLSRPRSEGGPR